MKFDRTIETASPAGFEWTAYVNDKGMREIGTGVESTYANADVAADKCFDHYVIATMPINS